MTKAEVLAALRAHNPREKEHDLRIYADAFTEYVAAQANIDGYGAVVMHPKTGAPVENPYLRIRDKAAATMQKTGRVKSPQSLWDACRAADR